jgi:histone H3/H4
MTMDAPLGRYTKCAICREPLAHDADAYRCSVSTCNRKRLTLWFCSVPCWDAHQSEARHRDAWAEVSKTPTEAQATVERRARAPSPERPREPVAKGARGAVGREPLVVLARLKTYVQERSGLAVSDRVAGPLSDRLRDLVDRAAERAQADGRKTLLDRDLLPLVQRRSAALGTSEVDDQPDVVLVVVSKLKHYVRESSGMNTSDAVIAILSGHIRYLARQAVREAVKDDRRTVLDRDAHAVAIRD